MVVVGSVVVVVVLVVAVVLVVCAAVSVVVVVCCVLAIECDMLCSAPFRRGVMEFGCGVCSPCLLKRRRLWTARLLLEAQLHESSLFVTLTYDKEHLPCDMSVSIRDAQLFLKRLRESVSPVKIRYFIVGEYGDVSQRPHYHAVLFGQVTPDQVRASWKMGFVHVGMLTGASASYVVSYTTKRMTGAVDVRLKGRKPEFARMSLKPGLGFEAMDYFAKDLFAHISKLPDVPACFRSEGRLQGIGRYLRNALRSKLGLPQGQPQGISDVMGAYALDKILVTGGRVSLEDRRVRDGHRARGLIRRANSMKEM